MKKIFRRLIGSLMIIAAIISLLVSAFFLAQIWRLRQPATTRVVENLDLLYATVVTMENSIILVDDTVSSLRASSESISESAASVADTVNDTSMMADSFATLLGDDLTNTITNTQTAIISAQSSAVVIDNVLTGLASIPFIGIDYNPQVPLNQALRNISDTLSAIPPSLVQIQGDLESTSTDLSQLEANLKLISQDLQDILITIAEAQFVIDEAQIEITQLKTRLEYSRSAAPGWILALAWVLTFVIAWLSISQLGLLLQGFDVLINTNQKAATLPDLHYG
jgi:hypothetical protein